MNIYLAVGHGQRPDGTYDPGAISADQRWSEQSAGDIIVAEAARLLRSWGATVRDEAFQADPNFRGSTEKANAWPAAITVAVHHDYSLAPVGAFGHWYTMAGKELADRIQNAVGAAGFPLRWSWHKYRSDIYIIKNVQGACCLYECGRIGQPGLDSSKTLKQMGEAIARGIAHYAGIPTEEDEMTDREKEMLQYAAMWSLEAKIDALIARNIAEGKLDDAAALKAKRTQDIKYWRERWEVV